MSRKACKKSPRTLIIGLSVLVALFFSERLYAGKDPLKALEIMKPKEKTKAPDFKLKNLEGQDISLSDFKGKVVFLNFWATWCIPCRKEMPSMEKLYQEFKDAGLVVLAINHRENLEKIKPFVEEMKLSFPILLDSEGKTSADYTVRGLPTSYFVNQEGVLIGGALGDRDWASEEAKDLIKILLK